MNLSVVPLVVLFPMADAPVGFVRYRMSGGPYSFTAVIAAGASGKPGARLRSTP